MLNTEAASKLRRSLVLHEGMEKYPYTDTVGKITIGIGYNLSDRGISDEWINRQYQEDVSYFYDQLSHYFWFTSLNSDRQIVIIDMAFMGIKKLLTFKKMIAALERRDFNAAADEMMDSTWAAQVKKRATDLSNAMRTGIYNI